MSLHQTVFQHNLVTGMHRARCICGWELVGRDLAALQDRAAVHDLDAPAERQASDVLAGLAVMLFVGAVVVVFA